MTDKKKAIKPNLPPEDLRGFEEFIEGQGGDSTFMKRQPPGVSEKKEVSFEHFTFLSNDSERLGRLKNLMMEQLPFADQHKQGEHIIGEQLKDLSVLKKTLFKVCNEPGSPYRKSIQEIFDSFFEPPKA